MASAAEGELYGAIAQLKNAYVGIAPAPADVAVEKLVDPQPEGAAEPVYETVYEPGVDPAVARIDTALSDFQEHMKLR